MSKAWLSHPIVFTGMRMFQCKKSFNKAECDYYKEHWHFWYIADYVFALSTVAFFMSAIGVFIIGHLVSSILLRSRYKRPAILSKLIATIRYLSYRGYHIKKLQWNSAPAGVILLGAAGTAFFFGMVLGPKPYYWVAEKFGGSPPLATRSGWLALGCMPFLFATASKTNWITLTTGVSHERLQVFHRWIAYAFFILALLHTFPFIIYHIHWHDMEVHFSNNILYYWTGIVALVVQAWLTSMSHSTIRNLGYEFFKVTHFAGVVVFMLTFFWHCNHTLTSWHYFLATAAVYVPCFIYPWLRTIFEYKWTQQAQVIVEKNGFTRVTIPVDFHWTPGQHCFLRFTSFGILHSFSSHPFTICSSPSRNVNGKLEIVFFIRHQDGFTKKLYQHALDYPGVPVPVLVDGPYGGVNIAQLRSADRQLIIAGGSGAGWCLPFIHDFITSKVASNDEEQAYDISVNKEGILASHANLPKKPSRSASLRVVLATRDDSSRIWFEQSVAEILKASPTMSSSVRLHVYLTGEAAKAVDSSTGSPISSAPRNSDPVQESTEGSENGSNSVEAGKEYEGRPQLPYIIQEEAAEAAGAQESLAVYVCGPVTMQNDVRNAVAAENMKIIKGVRSGGVYLHSEHFSWA